MIKKVNEKKWNKFAKKMQNISLDEINLIYDSFLLIISIAIMPVIANIEYTYIILKKEKTS